MHRGAAEIRIIVLCLEEWLQWLPGRVTERMSEFYFTKNGNSWKFAECWIHYLRSNVQAETKMGNEWKWGIAVLRPWGTWIALLESNLMQQQSPSAANWSDCPPALLHKTAYDTLFDFAILCIYRRPATSLRRLHRMKSFPWSKQIQYVDERHRTKNLRDRPLSPAVVPLWQPGSVHWAVQCRASPWNPKLQKGSSVSQKQRRTNCQGCCMLLTYW